jgi:hypothetical protein
MLYFVEIIKRIFLGKYYLFLPKTTQLLEKKSKCEFYIGVNIYFANCNIELKESASFLNQ